MAMIQWEPRACRWPGISCGMIAFSSLRGRIRKTGRRLARLSPQTLWQRHLGNAVRSFCAADQILFFGNFRECLQSSCALQQQGSLPVACRQISGLPCGNDAPVHGRLCCVSTSQGLSSRKRIFLTTRLPQANPAARFDCQNFALIEEVLS
jgi:hypothetical protein